MASDGIKFADLHCHTIGSDGEETPLTIIMRAYLKGIELVSITDHNSVKGYSYLVEEIRTLVETMSSRLEDPQEEPQILIESLERYKTLFEKVKILPGCEVLTIYEGCPFVEVLAYGMTDIESFGTELSELRNGLTSAGKILIPRFETIIDELKLDGDIKFYLENSSDYIKLIFHELTTKPNNFFDTFGIERTESGLQQFLENQHIDLNDSSTRKSRLIEWFSQNYNDPNIIETIKQTGSVMGQFYNQLKKSSTDFGFKSLKDFIYRGVYNRQSQFFVDLSECRPNIEKVRDLIHKYGGKALVAHWGRYQKTNNPIFDYHTKEGRENLEKIIDILDGAECFYPDNDTELTRLILHICNSSSKYVSSGGDNHGRGEKEGRQYRLGSMPPQSEELLSWIDTPEYDENGEIMQLTTHALTISELCKKYGYSDPLEEINRIIEQLQSQIKR